MSSYYDYYSSYFPSYHRWAEQNKRLATEDDDSSVDDRRYRRNRPKEGHSPWKIFSAVFLIVILILSIAAAIVVPVVVLQQSSASSPSSSTATTTAAPLPGTNVFFDVDLKIADSANWVWNSQLLDSTSALFKSKQDDLCTSMRSLFTSSSLTGGTYVSCQVNSFRFGSIYANIRFTINVIDTTNTNIVRLSQNIQILIQTQPSTGNAATSTSPRVPVDTNPAAITVNYVPATAKNPCAANPCQQICVPSDSSGNNYGCSCYAGYTFVSPNKCIELDECNTTQNMCLQPAGNCVNLPGTYRCDCNVGYQPMSTNTKACEAIKYCSFPNVTCDLSTTTCNNVPLGYTCSCLPGYANLQPNGSCLDIDECAVNYGYCDIYTTMCQNLPGSSQCICKSSGFAPISNYKRACQNIDECALRTDSCNPLTQYCVDTFGNYTCMCKDGYEVDPTTPGGCRDIRECEIATDNCDRISTSCINTPGRFNCTCQTGFMTNSTNRRFCNYIGYCPTTMNNCDKSSTVCVETALKQFRCDCKPGYNNLTNQTCQDINECLQPNNCDMTSQQCQNTPGNYTCNCKYSAPTTTPCTQAEYAAFVSSDGTLNNNLMNYKNEYSTGWTFTSPTNTLNAPSKGMYWIQLCAVVGGNSPSAVVGLIVATGNITVVGGATTGATEYTSITFNYMAQLNTGDSISTTSSSPVFNSITFQKINSLMAINIQTIFPGAIGFFANANPSSLTAGIISFAKLQLWSSLSTSSTTPSNPKIIPLAQNGIYVISFGISASNVSTLVLQLMVGPTGANLQTIKSQLHFGNTSMTLQTCSRTFLLQVTEPSDVSLAIGTGYIGSSSIAVGNTITLSGFQYSFINNIAPIQFSSALSPGSTAYSNFANLQFPTVIITSPYMNGTYFTVPVKGVYWVDTTLVAFSKGDLAVRFYVTDSIRGDRSDIHGLYTKFSDKSDSTTKQSLSRSALINLEVGSSVSVQAYGSSPSLFSSQYRDSTFSGFLLYPK